jgi:hypothetical protein
MSESSTESRFSPPDRSLTRECDACVTKREQIWTILRHQELGAKLMNEAKSRCPIETIVRRRAYKG